MMDQSFWKRCLMVALVTMVLTAGNQVYALSSSFGKIGAAMTTTNIVTGEEVMPCVETVDLGKDKLVNILVPPDELNRQKNGKRGNKILTSDGSGDVVWPSSFALASLIAHCPSVVEDRSILELGCGLGLVSAAVCKHARPDHVAMTDCDGSVLSMAYASCTRLNRSRASVSRSAMDWTDRSTWPAQNFDILLASDVLYEKNSILPLVNVLQNYLCKGAGDERKRAIIVDPVNQVNRDAFCYAADKAGLYVETTQFKDDLMLLNVRMI